MASTLALLASAQAPAPSPIFEWDCAYYWKDRADLKTHRMDRGRTSGMQLVVRAADEGTARLRFVAKLLADRRQVVDATSARIKCVRREP